jgi:monomeric isocitrate dehydrogenase
MNVNLFEKQLSTVYFKDVRFPWITLYKSQLIDNENALADMLSFIQEIAKSRKSKIGTQMRKLRNEGE